MGIKVELARRLLNRPVFLARQSPEWASLAQDYEAGLSIDVRRYKPGHGIPGFPNDIESLIARWNHLFDLNFFRCRQILKAIALETVQAIPNAQVVAEADYAAQAGDLAKSNALLFYMDDDDLFAPDLIERLAGVDLDPVDVAVFPLIRLGQTTYTFVRAGEIADTLVGPRRDFDFRFQTNNYAIQAGRVSPDYVAKLNDHVLASAYADRYGLSDAYFDRIVSATNKTPCSASGLPHVLRRQEHTISIVRQYIQALAALPIPASEAWLRGPIGKTIDLFDRLISSALPLPRLGVAQKLKLRLRFGW